MATSNPAEEHLRIIRSLMEKATIYRAISAPTALVGGCAGILAAAVFSIQSRKFVGVGDIQAEGRLFLACWITALIVAAVGNIYFLQADARRRGDKFVSAGMRAALRALWPSYLVAAACTILGRDNPTLLPIAWILLYGLGLLGTQHFAPRSIVFLGWAFLLTGLIEMSDIPWVSLIPNSSALFSRANLEMGLTFGGFHLIYAVCAWPRKSAVADAANAP